ncbi:MULTISPECIES: FtsK/SpoIIIE domain-containing protein [Nocardia]|uniref:FtsK/SpoIIIE domain-containing protein n=1 Tax=Nocardia TaxID=1817 RepID=UPI00135B8334|nr:MULTISPECIES: FtsK/SpoIIIE domain-containing protein [Nocardia]
MSIASSVMLAGGMCTGASAVWWLRSLAARGADMQPAGDVREVVAAAPVELRTAVLVVTDSGQRSLMWPAVGLGSAETGFPNVLSTTYTPFGMSVDVQMLGGQKLKDWTNEDTLDALAQYFGVPAVTAASAGPGFVRLDLRVYDTLADAVAAPLVAFGDGVDLEAVPTGVFEDGEVWPVPVQGRHVLIAGGMGSGKSTVLHALVKGMGPAIRSGRVDLRLIDPKGRMELGHLEPLCTQFAHTEPEFMIAQLEATVADMKAAADRYGQDGVRKPVPTPENPLVVTIIDEAAVLSAFTTSELRNRFEHAHGQLLSQGRAPLFSVIETVIDPSKDTVPQRQLLPYRIGMRMDEPTQVAMIHGQGARERGSRCDEIPHSTPGVCYVQEDGKPGFRRARAFHITNADIDWIVKQYTPLPRPVSLADFDGFGGFDDGPVAA